MHISINSMEYLLLAHVPGNFVHQDLHNGKKSPTIYVVFAFWKEWNRCWTSLMYPNMLLENSMNMCFSISLCYPGASLYSRHDTQFTCYSIVQWIWLFRFHFMLKFAGQRFALREGGRTVGAGVVSKVISWGFMIFGSL